MVGTRKTMVTRKFGSAQFPSGMRRPTCAFPHEHLDDEINPPMCMTDSYT